MKYQITVNEKQLQAISDACELMTRLSMGQLDAVLEHVMLENEHDYDLTRQLTRFGEQHIKQQRNNTCYDLHQVCRHQLAWDRKPEGDHMNVHFDKPIQFGTDDLAVVEKLEG